MLTNEHFNEIVALLLLLPEMGDRKARKAIVERALFGSTVVQQITWDDDEHTFTVQLVRLLDKFGETTPGKQAVVALLEQIRPRVGADRQLKIEDLLTRLRPPISPPAVSQVEPPPRPNHVPNPSYKEHPVLETTLASEPIPKRDVDTSPHSTINTPRWPRKEPFRPNILVMKGGGVKGIAYVGALNVLEEYGYHFDHFVGTSAGAISAALLAVG